MQNLLSNKYLNTCDGKSLHHQLKKKKKKRAKFALNIFKYTSIKNIKQ